MLIESRPPCRSYAVARLQDWLETRTGSTAYKAEMTAMLARHQFKDGIALPVTPGSEHDAFVSPLHSDSRPHRSTLLLWKLQPHGPIPLRIVCPVFPHFDKQKQMNFCIRYFRDVLARSFADCLDGLTALPKYDFSLAFALHINCLLHPDVAATKLLPDVGLYRRIVRQLLMQALEELFARELGGHLAQRRLRELVGRIKPGALGYVPRQPGLQVAHAVARQSRNHEGRFELCCRVGVFRQREQFFF